MKSKAQLALDIIRENEDEAYTIESVWRAIDTLQKAIDRQAVLQAAFDKACELLEEGYGNYYAAEPCRDRVTWKDFILKNLE